MPPELEREVLLHALLMALTRYVPLPFLDDALRQAAFERMVRRLAAANQRTLSDQEVKELTEDRSGCCAGCLFSLVSWPFRKVLARLLIVWDLNRTLELASRSFVAGYLIYLAFHLGLYDGKARRLRDAVDEAAARAGTSPVQRVLTSVLGGARKKLREAGQLLARKLRRQPPAPEEERELARAVLDEVEAEEREVLETTLQRIGEGLRAIPASYYAELERALREALRRQSQEAGKDALF